MSTFPSDSVIEKCRKPEKKKKTKYTHNKHHGQTLFIDNTFAPKSTEKTRKKLKKKPRQRGKIVQRQKCTQFIYFVLRLCWLLFS